MFRLYRQLAKGEFFIAFGDTSQGGEDANFMQFGSKTRMDVPLVMQKQGVAAEVTPFIISSLTWIYKQTGIKPIVCLERNNGGASEMYNLIKYNPGTYTIFYMRDETGKQTDVPGWNTTEVSRSTMLGDWLMAYESKQIIIYDDETQSQHQTFIVNQKGKPEAAVGTHDDAVMSAAGMWQVMKLSNPPAKSHRRTEHKKLKMHV